MLAPKPLKQACDQRHSIKEKCRNLNDNLTCERCDSHSRRMLPTHQPFLVSHYILYLIKMQYPGLSSLISSLVGLLMCFGQHGDFRMSFAIASPTFESGPQQSGTIRGTLPWNQLFDTFFTSTISVQSTIRFETPPWQMNLNCCSNATKYSSPSNSGNRSHQWTFLKCSRRLKRRR